MKHQAGGQDVWFPSSLGKPPRHLHDHRYLMQWLRQPEEWPQFQPCHKVSNKPPLQKTCTAKMEGYVETVVCTGIYNCDFYKYNFKYMTNAVCVSSPCLSIWKPTKSASDTDHLNSYNSLESHDVFSLIIELFIQAIWRHKIIWFKWCSVRSLPIVTITGIHRVHKHKNEHIDYLTFA